MKVSFYNEKNDTWYFDEDVVVVGVITIYESFVASVDFTDGSFIDIYVDPNGRFVGKIYKDV